MVDSSSKKQFHSNFLYPVSGATGYKNQKFVFDCGCNHEQHHIQDGLKYCDDCGMELEHMSVDVDWRSFGAPSGTREENGKNTQKRSIVNDLILKKFSKNAALIANIFYQKIVNAKIEKTGKSQIFRRCRRDALMAVCVFYAQVEIKEPMSAKSDTFKSNLPKLTAAW